MNSSRPPPLLPHNPIDTPLALFLFVDWKRELLRACPGPSRLDVADMGDPLLALLFEDGCEPTLASLLDYAMAGLSAGEA
jgi:hypothetical protein